MRTLQRVNSDSARLPCPHCKDGWFVDSNQKRWKCWACLDYRLVKAPVDEEKAA